VNTYVVTKTTQTCEDRGFSVEVVFVGELKLAQQKKADLDKELENEGYELDEGWDCWHDEGEVIQIDVNDLE